MILEGASNQFPDQEIEPGARHCEFRALATDTREVPTMLVLRGKEGMGWAETIKKGASQKGPTAGEHGWKPHPENDLRAM